MREAGLDIMRLHFMSARCHQWSALTLYMKFHHNSMHVVTADEGSAETFPRVRWRR